MKSGLVVATVLLTLAATMASADGFETRAAVAESPVPAHGVIGVRHEHLDPAYWIARLEDARRPFLAPDAIARRNQALVRADPTVHDLASLPATLTRAEVAAWLAPYSTLPERALFDQRGAGIPARTLRGILRNAALDRVAGRQPVRLGLVTRRADLRSFPTRLRVFHSADDHDIDRFQESALFPGTPVAVLHESRDRRWWFVASPRYAAWIERRHVALGDRAQVLGYGERSPYLVVTGADVRTVHSPGQPQVSGLQLDMGVRVPLRTDWPADRLVNGQHPYAAHVIELPQRDADGRLELVPALLPRSADVAPHYLPATPAHVLEQAFKFLGERYGWGHSYGARDCSGFVSEVWRSLGVELPRNTRDQAASEVFDRIAFEPATPRAERFAVLAGLQVGDLVYIPGHVMMVIGRDAGLTYVIHDTTGIGYLHDGAFRRMPLNSVAVTPLEPLMADATTSYVDRIHTIQRLRPPRMPNSASR